MVIQNTGRGLEELRAKDIEIEKLKEEIKIKIQLQGMEKVTIYKPKYIPLLTTIQYLNVL